MSKKGLIIIYTGDGKGKTTAALGQAVRAGGHGFKVCIIQFIKGRWQTGEALALQRFAGQIELHVTGTGFTWEAESFAAIKNAALTGWDLAKGKIADKSYDMVVLDELTYLINKDIISEVEVLDVIKKRPAGQHLVITGREAGAGLIAAADLVTEMRLIKHPFSKGIKAQKGIEF